MLRSAFAHVGFLSLSLFCLVLLGCNPQPSYTDVQRLASPDGAVYAHLVLVDTDATVGFVHELSIAPTKGSSTTRSVALRGDQFENLRITWVSRDCLMVQYDRGRIFHYQRLWKHKDVENIQRQIAVRLLPANLVGGAHAPQC